MTPDLQKRAEGLLRAQNAIRRLYRAGRIEEALREYDTLVRPALCAVDPRVARLARRISVSFVSMADRDLAADTANKGTE